MTFHPDFFFFGQGLYLHGVGKGDQYYFLDEMGDTEVEIFKDESSHLSKNRWHAKLKDNGV